MLWDAGQQRIGRESRDRLAELYVGVRDGYVAGSVATGRARFSGTGRHVPEYIRESSPTPSLASQQATLARLGAMFPGTVRRGDS